MPSNPGGERSARQRLLARLHMASALAALIAIGVGLAVFFGGWVGHVSFLRTILRGTPPMKVNTALGLVSLGAAVWLEGYGELRREARRLALIPAGITTTIGALTALEYVTRRDLYIDELLVRDYTITVSSNPPGRMAIATAISFILLGCALLLIKRLRGVVVSQSLAIAVGGLCLVNLTGYLYGIQNFSGPAFYTAIATSLTLFILCLGLLCATATAGLMATVTSEQLGGVLARRLLPAALLAPVSLGWLTWHGELRGYYDHAFGIAMATSASVAIFMFLIWTHSELLNRLDQERQRSYQRAIDSEANFRQLADSMPQIVYTARADGWLDYCNQRWIDYTGLTVTQSQGWGSLAVIHPDDVKSVVEVWDRTVATGISYEIEFRLKRALDGAYRWHLGRGEPMRDNNGRITKWFGTSTDIDDYKHTQQALEESRQQLEVRVQERTVELERSNELLNAILNSMGDGVICINDKYEHVLFNRAAHKLLGSSPEQATPERRAAAFGIYHPDKKTLFNREELPLGRALRGESCDNVEIFGRLPEQAEERWLSCNSRPMKDSSDKVYGAVLVMHDITERRRLEESRTRLLAILEETSDFVGTARPEGTILYANRALRSLRGLAEGESIEGLRVGGAYAPSVAKQMIADAMQTAIQFGAWRGENVFRYHTGEEIPVSQLIMSHRNSDGEVEFMSTIARDISEIKDKEAQLKQVQQQLEAALEKERGLSRQDPLTGLANRRAFLEASEIEKERSRRYHHCFNIAYIDLDSFKAINDQLGHAIGDEVLIQVAATLRSNLRLTDIVARLGGDEFAVLLTETDPTSAEKVLRKLHELLRATMKAHGWNVDFSIGLASYRCPPESIDTIIRTADGLMYSVKAKGKGNVAVALLS
jgi:diguanylate cyclase (GGDEF)-like protein/PAS domain S-box-containing protein